MPRLVPRTQPRAETRRGRVVPQENTLCAALTFSHTVFMAFRIHESVVRGEIDNREKGFVRGRIWVHGRTEPVVLELRGNAHPDLAGCLLTFTNPFPTTAHPGLDSLHPDQRGSIGDLTASRKVRAFDVPLTEALEMIHQGEKPPEHLANCLYLEWYSERNGRVVIESADYRLEISPPAWRLSPEEEKQRAEQAAAGFDDFLGKVSAALDKARFTPPEDRPMNEFEWEKAFRESDALTDKAMELQEKYGDRPDFEEILARELGWDGPGQNKDKDEAEGGPWNVDAINRAGEEAAESPLEPNPLTEGVDWVRDELGGVSHPLELRVGNSAMELWNWCDERDLLGEQGDKDLHDMIFKLQCCGAKCAGVLGGLAYEGRVHEPGFIVAGLKRALGLLHDSLKAADGVKSKGALPPEKLEPFLKELFAVREEILGLMKRFRDEST